MTSDPTKIRKRSVSIAGHQTSVYMEDAFWQRLGKIATARDMSVSALIRDIDTERTGNLSSALRVFVLTQSDNY